MNVSAMQTCSALVHKFEVNVCSFLNSSETDPPTHLHIPDKNKVKNEEKKEEEEEEHNNEMIVSSDISKSSKEQIETTMGNKIPKTKSKMTNFTELTDDQIKTLVSTTNFSAQQVREWHQSELFSSLSNFYFHNLFFRYRFYTRLSLRFI